MKITIRVTLNAKQSEVLGLKEGILKVRLHAKPHDNQANEELIRVLSEHYSIPKSYIRLIKGRSSREKLVELPPDTLTT